MEKRIDVEKVISLQAAIANLSWSETIRMNGWRIWRNAGEKDVKEACVWVESPRGWYAMYRGHDYEKVERILELMSESRD